MGRIIIPLSLLVAAFGLFAVYVNPTYQTIKELDAQNTLFDQALTKSTELQRLRDQLIDRRNQISPANIEKLERVLPDNVDNIRLIIDINNIAGRRGLTLSNVSLGDVGAAANKTAAVGTGGRQIGVVRVGFTVSASYDTFLLFLQDLEHSLRIVDVTKLSFAPGANDINTYTVEIQTYWLH